MVNWILEDGVFGRSLKSLASEIHQQGHNCKIVDYTRGITNYQNFFDPNECIIFYGSLYLAQKILRQKNLHQSYWIPGIIGTIANYKCTSYYPDLKPWLLNADSCILPLSQLASPTCECSEWLLNLEEDARVFVRPNSPLKPFAGGIYCLTDVLNLDRFMNRHYLEDPDISIVIASEKPIEAEWRAIVSQGQILCASQYRQFGKPYYRAGMPDTVQQVARAVAQQPWQPDPIWVLDLCRSGNAVYVLEINFFSCSALYRCEPSSIVREVSNLAWQQWVEINRKRSNSKFPSTSKKS